MSVISPLAVSFPHLPDIAGVTLRIARAGYKDWGRCDLTFVELNEGTTVAGATTRNVCSSPEVDLCRENLKGGKARALVVNAGNSNAVYSNEIKKNNTVVRVVRILATFLIVLLGWIFFRAESLPKAWYLFCKLITLNSGAVGNNSSGGCGVQIRDNDIDSKGYFKTNANSDAYLIKAP